ncbi:MAG: hypothetical protein Q9160_003055 [Pyrenula sp. 1 TL-2023]
MAAEPPLVAESAKIRIAVEGCGHGTLNEIYSSLEERSRARGWENVDLLIICGDFQACRNQHDLNVTAMPAKYRRMADFHEYYSGIRKAPCLTVFVGGNHEASNYLFELYYGGWVAPNIYYLGTANVIRFGPLRIAGLSGIYKRYDYYKPHFERLPYNESDYYGIYHVRELDVRKMLNIRTQVDIGISHDWPQGVEWSGNHTKLFNRKAHLRSDAEAGRLGSPAAKYCLDRLRPTQWFSAHLHIKYEASIRHGEHSSGRGEGEHRSGPFPSLSNIAHRPGTSPRVLPDTSSAYTQALSAWNAFPAVAFRVEADETKRIRKEQQEEREGEGSNATKNPPSYTFNETWKQVHTNDDLRRELNSVQRTEVRSDEIKIIPQVDGAVLSAITPFKRKQSPVSQANSQDPASKLPKTTSTESNDFGDATPHKSGDADFRNDVEDHKNKDEIAIDLDDTDDGPLSPKPSEAANAADYESDKKQMTRSAAVNDSRSIENRNHQPLPSLIDTDSTQEGMDRNGEHRSSVSADLRSQLASISGSFAPTKSSERSAALRPPKDITNTVTSFLALDKCESHRQFLELDEISPISEHDGHVARPYQLAYDKEWLAITRAFSSELELGGSPGDRCPPNLGEPVYSKRVEEEEKWVEENLVRKGLMKVPADFAIIAPIYDPQGNSSQSMPREYPNPQTDTFCKLVGIENKFDISDADIDQRIAQGPRPENTERHHNKAGGRGQNNRAGRGGFRGGGYRGGRGGRGWRQGGRGR